MSSTLEVIVINPAYWASHAPQLALLLRGASERGHQPPIGDPSGVPPNPDAMATIIDPGYWSAQPRELEDALASGDRGMVATERHGAGVAPSAQERLTLTVEEAAAALGISRAFAYEAVRRGEIPSIKIGRRVLVPKAALHRMMEAPQN